MELLKPCYRASMYMSFYLFLSVFFFPVRFLSSQERSWPLLSLSRVVYHISGSITSVFYFTVGSEEEPVTHSFSFISSNQFINRRKESNEEHSVSTGRAHLNTVQRHSTAYSNLNLSVNETEKLDKCRPSLQAKA